MRISAHHLKLFEQAKPARESKRADGAKGHAAARAAEKAEGAVQAEKGRGKRGAEHAEQAGAASLVSLSPDAISAYARKALETKVGQTIAAAFEEAGVDLPSAVDQDWSPEATAQRIFDFSTSLFDVFKGQHDDLSDADVLTQFETTLRGAVDRGYKAARSVLDGMSVSDEVTDMGEATMTALHSLFDDYFGARKATGEAVESSSPGATTSAAEEAAAPPLPTDG